MRFELEVEKDGMVYYIYDGAHSLLAFCHEDRARDIIGDAAERGEYRDFPIKAGKFNFKGKILQEGEK